MDRKLIYGKVVCFLCFENSKFDALRLCVYTRSVGSQVVVGALAAQRCPMMPNNQLDPTSVLLVEGHVYLRSIHT
jgi:hypothetical protein